MNTQEFLNYEAPQVEVIEVEVEKGFAASNTISSSNINDLGYEPWQ